MVKEGGGEKDKGLNLAATALDLTYPMIGAAGLRETKLL